MDSFDEFCMVFLLRRSYAVTESVRAKVKARRQPLNLPNGARHGLAKLTDGLAHDQVARELLVAHQATELRCIQLAPHDCRHRSLWRLRLAVNSRTIQPWDCRLTAAKQLLLAVLV